MRTSEPGEVTPREADASSTNSHASPIPPPQRGPPHHGVLKISPIDSAPRRSTTVSIEVRLDSTEQRRQFASSPRDAPASAVGTSAHIAR
jgi:hypothetical protein